MYAEWKAEVTSPAKHRPRLVRADRRPVRRFNASRYLLYLLVSFGLSVLVTRVFLELTGYPKIGGLLHHKTHLGDAQRLEEIVVQPSVGQFHHEITQRTAVLGRVGGVLQGLQQLERLGVEFFGIAEAQRGRLG